MKKIKKHDIVSRISYKNDILFYVEKIIKAENGIKIAILKGINVRIIADAPIDDLNLIESKNINDEICNTKRVFALKNNNESKQRFIKNGKILHLDGDRKYSEKSIRYYRSLGLNAIVKNIAENRQFYFVRGLLETYKPDILVITGHDGMVKKGTNFSDIYNYRNSFNFIKAVKEARRWNNDLNELVIFAGACQSFYEALIEAGANFASSPNRILIDFMDPLVVARRIATTDINRFITISDIENEIRDGRKGVNGVGAFGKKKVVITNM